jgi:hypothetical protein
MFSRFEKILVVLSVCLLTAVSLSMADVEPNGSFATAETAEIGVAIDGSLSSGDSLDLADFYRVEVPGNGLFIVSVVPDSELNVEVYLFDEAQDRVLFSSNAGGVGVNEGINFRNIQAGTYYVVVRIPDAVAATAGTYSMTIYHTPVEFLDAEPNDGFSQAVPISPSSEMTGNIGYHGNKYTDHRDYYVVTVPVNGALKVTLEPDGTSNMDLYMYDSVNVKQLRSSTKGGKGEVDSFSYDNLAAGTYYLLVTNVSGYGSYNLNTQFTPAQHEEIEPNDSPGNAIELTLDANTHQGQLGYTSGHRGDFYDYFKIVTLAYGDITLTMTKNSEPNLDTEYMLFGSDGQYVSNTGNETATFSNLNAGTYYVRMRTSGANYGSYTLTYDFTEKDAPAVFSGSATALGPNAAATVEINENITEEWFRVTLPGDGQLTVLGTFNGLNGYVDLYEGEGRSRYRNIYVTSPNAGSIVAPDLLAGDYLIKVTRWQNAGTVEISTEFIPTTRNDVEFNDDPFVATPVAVNTTVVGHLGYQNLLRRDVGDYFVFTVEEEGSLTFTYEADATANFYCNIYDHTGNNWNRILDVYSSAGTLQTRTKPNIAPGTYVLEIAHWTGYGEYSVDIDFVPHRGNDDEPSSTKVGDIREIAIGEGVVGHLGYENAVYFDGQDYYKIVLPQDGHLKINYHADATGGFYHRLYDGALKTKLLDQYVGNNAGQFSQAKADLQAGTYYIVIERWTGYGTYHFFTEFQEKSMLDPANNHIADSAETISLGETAQGTLGYSSWDGEYSYTDTADWYVMNVPQDGRYKWSMNTSASGGYHFQLYNASRTSRIRNDYIGSRPQAAYHNFDLAAGTYYICVSRWTGYGPYSFNLGTEETISTGSVKGSVKSNSGSPLPDVKVRLENIEINTDFIGGYTIDGLAPGTYRVSFDSGSKYYPVRRDIVIETDAVTTLDIVMNDSNKTAPADPAFFGLARDQYIHLYWSASVSADVATGGGYKLSIDGGEPMDLGNVLSYRSLGFENGVTYSFHLTVYDQYGNESEGQTIYLQPSGDSVIPTPTPTPPPGEPTPTRTPVVNPTPTNTPVAVPTPTPTNTPVIDEPTPTATPVIVIPTATPTEVQDIGPVFKFEFDKGVFSENGWSDSVLTGFTPGTPAGFVKAGLILGDMLPDSEDGKGLMVSVRPVAGAENLDELCFLFCTSQIETHGLPVLIHAYVQVEVGSNASVFIGALKGSLVNGSGLDGSIAYVNPQTTVGYQEPKRIVLLYQPDSDVELVTPFIQVVAKEGSGPATVYVDKIEVFLLHPDEVYPGTMFVEDF